MLRILVLFSALWVALPASAQDYPRYENLYVNDFGNLLAPIFERRITLMLEDLREEEGIEFTVVTVRSMSDYNHLGLIESFATGLFNEWGVGNASRNDGVLMLVSRYDRKMRIEVGAGYGDSLNRPMKRIIDRTITPLFKENRYGAGIEAGTRAVIAEITGSWPGEDTFTQKLIGMLGRILQAMSFLLYPFLASAAGLGIWLWRRSIRYGARRCSVDGQKMQLLAEHVDDPHLSAGQLKEESLRSVDYDVWECPSCAHVKIEAYSAWFSRYGACPTCHYKTLEGKSTTLKAATKSRTGLRRIDYTCKNCDHTHSEEKVIPKVRESSSSSGGGRSSSSSFGGGRSSGGGASGSW